MTEQNHQAAEHAEMRAVVAQEAGIRAIVKSVSDVMAVPEAQRSMMLASGLTVQAEIDKITPDIDEARAIIIDSPVMLDEAQNIAGRLATVCADSGVIENERKALTKPLVDMQRWINAGYNAPREYIARVLGGDNGKGGLKGKILAYHQKMQDEQRKRDAEEAEKRRKIAEEAAAAEAKAIEEAKALVQQATDAQAAGSEQVAMDMFSQAAVQVDTARQVASAAVASMHTPTASYSAPRASGVRDVYKAEARNKAALIIAIGKQLESGDMANEDLLDVNQSNLNRRAAMQKLNLKLPGVEVTKEQALSTRKKAI